MINPKSIKRAENNTIDIIWADSFASRIKIDLIRKECPCAECRGEELNNKPDNKHQIKFQMFNKGMNNLVAIKQVGNYAISLEWEDGHDTGIYNWDYLREICEKHNLL